MKRTVEEKYQYNKKRKGLFASGYCMGVNLYRDYPKQDEEGKLNFRFSCDYLLSFMMIIFYNMSSILSIFIV